MNTSGWQTQRFFGSSCDGVKRIISCHTNFDAGWSLQYIHMYPPSENPENKSERAPRRHAPNTGERFADMSNEAEQATATPLDNKRQLTNGQLQPHREGLPIIPNVINLWNHYGASSTLVIQKKNVVLLFLRPEVRLQRGICFQ